MQQLVEFNRRRGAIAFEPQHRQQRPQRVEILLQRHLLGAQIGAFGGLGHAAVVIHAALDRIDRRQQRACLLTEATALDVADRRLHPFDERRIRLPEQPQRLAQVPAVEVDVIDNRVFDDIAPFFQIHCLVPARFVGVDEAHVVIGVGRGEAPGTAAGFDREQDAHAVLLFGTREPLHDLGMHVVGNGGVAGRGDIDGGHDALMVAKTVISSRS